MKKKQLFIIRKGTSYLAIKADDLVMVFTCNEITYLIDREGNKWPAAQHLNGMEQELDHRFFRANRQTIINIDFIRSFRQVENKGLEVQMQTHPGTLTISISPGTVSKFKEWIAAC